MAENGGSSVSVDPVSAIANAIGSLFESVGSVADIFKAKKEEDIAYQQWLNLGVPDLIDHFPAQSQKKDNTWILMAVLGLVFIVLVLAIVFTKK